MMFGSGFLKKKEEPHESGATKKKKRLGREELTLNLMILPGLIILIIFVFAPLVGR